MTASREDQAGRARARRLYPDVEPCEVCGRTGAIDRHHRNSNRMDNRPENIAFLCRRDHAAAHQISDGKVGGGPRPRVYELQRERARGRAMHARFLLQAGAPIAEVAEILHVHPVSVWRWLRKYAA